METEEETFLSGILLNGQGDHFVGLDDLATDTQSSPDADAEVLPPSRAKKSNKAIENLWTKKEETDKEKEQSKQERFLVALEIDKENLSLEKVRAEAELKRADADQKRADAEQKRAEAELLKQEKDIMLASESGLNPAQLQWLKVMQDDIVAKRCGNQV